MSTADQAQALGVGTLLEATLQHSTGQFRVNVRLVNAHSGRAFHARSFESPEAGIYRLQQQIADDTAAQLGTGQQEQFSRPVPTENLAAYELYLRGREEERRPENEVGINALKAATDYEQALAIDPKFALAAVRLANTYARLYWQEDNWDFRPVYLHKAQAAVEKAVQLQPELPETHGALGYYYYYGHCDYEHALGEFKIAQSALPNDSEIALAIGLVQRRRAQWEESLANLARAVELDPLNARFLTILADTYEGLRRYDEAERILDRLVALTPATPDVAVQQATLIFKRTGSVAELRRVVNAIDPAHETDLTGFARFECNMMEHKFDQAVADLQRSNLPKFETEWGIFPKELLCGLALLAKGDRVAAAGFVQRSCASMGPVVERNTEGPRLRIALALAYAGLGRKAEAMQQGILARDERSVAVDAVAGPPITATLARIYTLLGDKADAVRELAKSSNVPFGICRSRLANDPAWDPLRNDPGFQRLITQQSSDR